MKVLRCVCMGVLMGLLVVGPLTAYTIYLKDGSTIQAKSKYRIDGQRAYIVLLNGTQSFIGVEKIDIERTEAANARETLDVAPDLRETDVDSTEIADSPKEDNKPRARTTASDLRDVDRTEPTTSPSNSQGAVQRPTPPQSAPSPGTQTRWLLYTIGTAFSLLCAFGLYAYRQQRRLVKRPIESPLKLETAPRSAPDRVELLHSPVSGASGTTEEKPGVPEELLEACVQGRCMLFGGNALGVQAGYPSWLEALGKMIDKLPSLREEERQTLRSSLASGKVNVVTEFLVSRSREDVIKAASVFYKPKPTSVPSFVKEVQSIPFVGVLTTHWHEVLTTALAHRRPLVLVAGASDVPPVIDSNIFLLVKLFGSLESSELIFTPSEYRRALEDSPALAKLLTSLTLTRTLLFIGVSLEMVEMYFANLQIRSKPSRPHFALVPVDPELDLHRERLLVRYGVHLLAFRPTPNMAEETEFVARLRKEIVHWAGRTPKNQTDTTNLTRVRLRNIGPFRDLSIDLNTRWNVLLGNNGVGKSTLLRAVALGLCGDHQSAQECAQRLLTTGQENGFIELSVGQDIYRTELVREQERVRSICYQLTPLQTGNWAVLGFPPLRGASSRNLRGPSADGISRPVVADIQPLLEGDLDRRFDQLRQWIVNIDARTTPGGGITEAEARKNKQMMSSFFSLLRTFMPGMAIDFCEVDRRSWNVLVKTEDGVVPIEQISKGMSSLIGWLGTLLQRMYEIHSSADRPEHEPAFVVIDEIDAHLHPEWQQMLVPTLKRCFPRLQIIATTHSPLIVAGMQRDEVLIVFRSDSSVGGRAIEVSPPPLDFDGMRADQILTSPLFGLASTRSQGARKDIDRYSELLGKAKRSKDEEKEFASLKDKLRIVLSVGETAVERSVEQAVRVALDDLTPATLVSQADPKIQLEVKRQLAQVLGRERGEP